MGLLKEIAPRTVRVEPARYVPRSIYEGARDMARQIASSWEGRTARRLRKKIVRPSQTHSQA
jgi:hypothetical protein